MHVCHPAQSCNCHHLYDTNDLPGRIMSRFQYIHLIGDSMIRHLAQAINVLIREDLLQGARATWKKGNPEGLDCYCHTLFDKHKCASDGYAALDTVEIWQHDPSSIKCPSEIAKVDCKIFQVPSILSKVRKVSIIMSWGIRHDIANTCKLSL